LINKLSKGFTPPVPFINHVSKGFSKISRVVIVVLIEAEGDVKSQFARD